jgi:hypothetical protein
MKKVLSIKFFIAVLILPLVTLNAISQTVVRVIQTQQGVSRILKSNVDFPSIVISQGIEFKFAGGIKSIKSITLFDSVKTILLRISYTQLAEYFKNKTDSVMEIKADGSIAGFSSSKITTPFTVSIVNSGTSKPISQFIGGNARKDINPSKVDTIKKMVITQATAGHPKIAYYDAMDFEKSLRKHDYGAMDKVINAYFNCKLDTGNKHFDTAALNYCTKDNPFLRPMLDTIKVFNQGTASGGLNASSFSLSSIGGLDVTNIADGFAKFLVKRVKQELSSAFFDKFKEDLSKPEFRDIRSLFPQTYRTLTAIGDQIYMYDAYIQTLRDSFEKDLSVLLNNLPSVIDNHPEFFSKQPTLEAMCRSAIYIGQQIQRKAQPGDILANFDTAWLSNINPSLNGGICTLKLLSNSFRDKTSKDYWVSPDSILHHFEDPVFLNIYFGLIYQQSAGIKFSKDSLKGYLSSVAKNTQYLEKYKEYIEGFVSKIDDIQSLFTATKKMKKDSISFAVYHDYFDKTLGLLEYSTKLFMLPGLKINIGIDTVNFQKYFDIASSVSDIALDVSQRKYSSAIVSVTSIYHELFANSASKTTLIDSLKKAKSDRAQNEYAFLNSPDGFISNILKYGTFMSTIVEAKTSNDVESAIEAFAMPPGSSSVKRNSAFNVSLNAYTGLFAGCEQINGVDKPGLKNFAFNSSGVTAPIGISVSRGHSVLFFIGTGKCAWSSTLFISLVDIGALVSFRFQNDSVAQVPKVELKDIISPGLFYSLGIPKCPLSLNAGLQFGPNLRQVGTTSNTYGNNIYVRYSFSICVDIPILNFYTKPIE